MRYINFFKIRGGILELGGVFMVIELTSRSNFLGHYSYPVSVS